MIEALLQQDVVGRAAKKLVIQETASVSRLRLGGGYEKFAAELREEARDREPAFKEALEDFLKKNKTDTKIIFPTNAPKAIELVSDAVVKEIFSVRHDAKTNGWALFYQRFPGSGGLITLSRVGIDRKGAMAIVYLGSRSHDLAGSGRIRIFQREDKKWVLSNDSIGPQCVS